MFIVECSDRAGLTIWLADFAVSELELLTKIETIGLELSNVATDSKTIFGSLSAAQLNWKPAPKSWSVAQCFDHLITTHSLYFPEFERLANG